jgi:hypothetical protein
MVASTHEAGWRCEQCGEDSPSTLDVCWSCGASRDGEPDPSFEPVRDAGDSPTNESPWSPPQWSLGEMFVWMTGSALFAAALIHLPAELVLVGVVLWIALTPFSRQITGGLRKLAGRLCRRHRGRGH